MTARGDGEQFSAIELECWTRKVLLVKDVPLVEEMLPAESWPVVENVGVEVCGEVNST